MLPRLLPRLPPLRARPLAPVAASLAFALAASGCGGTSGGDAAASPSGQKATSAAPTASGPSSTGSPSRTPSGTGSATPSGSAAPGGLRGRLLSADQMPGFNPSFSWVVASTGPERPSTSLGTCQRFSILSIGAERAVVRRFAPKAPHARRAGHDRAGELVATFPDALTARRAYAVLEAWRATCADRLPRHDHGSVGDLQDVSAGDRAGWYLLTYGPVRGDPDTAFFDAQGMVVRGSRLAMVSLVLAGQDYDYEPGHEPMVTALRRAAQRLA